MRAELTIDVAVNSILMVRRGITGAIWITEDHPSARIYEHIAAKEAYVTMVAHDPIRVLAEVERRGCTGAIAVTVSSGGEQPKTRSVFHTDFGHVDALLLDSPALDKALLEVAGRPWITGFEAVWGPPRPRFVKLMHDLAAVEDAFRPEGAISRVLDTIIWDRLSIDSTYFRTATADATVKSIECSAVRSDSRDVAPNPVEAAFDSILQTEEAVFACPVPPAPALAPAPTSKEDAQFIVETRKSDSAVVFRDVVSPPKSSATTTSARWPKTFDAVDALYDFISRSGPQPRNPSETPKGHSLQSILRAAYELDFFESSALFWKLHLWELRNPKHRAIRTSRRREPFGILLDQSYWQRDLGRHLEQVGKESPLLVMKLDLDHFKKVNDTLGHGRGDEALKSYFQIIKEIFGGSADIYRRGGDEVVALAPNIPPNTARSKAESIRKRVEVEFSAWPVQPTPTASIGAVVVSGNASFTQVVTALDDAERMAKDHGRNQVILTEL